MVEAIWTGLDLSSSSDTFAVAEVNGKGKIIRSAFVLGGSPFYKCGCYDPVCILDGCKRGCSLDPKTSDLVIGK